MSQAPDASALLEAARQASLDGRLDAAVIEYRNVLQIAPDNHEARWRLGQTYLALRQPAPALKELGHALPLAGLEPQLCVDLARARVQTGQFQRTRSRCPASAPGRASCSRVPSRNTPASTIAPPPRTCSPGWSGRSDSKRSRWASSFERVTPLVSASATYELVDDAGVSSSGFQGAGSNVRNFECGVGPCGVPGAGGGPGGVTATWRYGTSTFIPETTTAARPGLGLPGVLFPTPRPRNRH